MAPINLGVIGLSAEGSWASSAHLPYLVGAGKQHYTITALQNSSKASAEKAAEKYGLGGVSTYGDPESIANDPNVDLVAISVRVPQHYELVVPALNAKKDVFIEWPLAANLKEAEEIVALAKKQGVKTIVGLQARQNPSIRRAREIVANGDLGDILGTVMFASGIIFGPVGRSSFEYGLPIENGANLLTIPAGHAIDALCYVLGEWTDLQATLRNNRPNVTLVDGEGKTPRTVPKTSHDQVSVQGNLERGGVATVVYQPGVSLTGKNFYWEINGTKGSLVLEADMGHVQMYHPRLKMVKAEEGAKLEEVAVEEAKAFSDNVGTAWEAFVGKGDGSVTTFEDALLRHKMIDAIYRSNEKGTRETYL